MNLFRRNKPGHPRFGEPDAALARVLARHMASTNEMIVIRYLPQIQKVKDELDRMKITYELVMPHKPKRKRIVVKKTAIKKKPNLRSVAQ